MVLSVTADKAVSTIGRNTLEGKVQVHGPGTGCLGSIAKCLVIGPLLGFAAACVVALHWRKLVDRAQKEELVAELKTAFNETTSVVVTHYSGLSVAELTDLRARMREAGAQFRVTKNRLTKLALDGTKCDPLAQFFAGPTAIAYSDDPVAAAKVTVEFAKDNEKLIVLGGMMDETELDSAGIAALAKMPSLDELRGKIIGVLSAPATKVAGVLQAPAGQVARVIGAYGASDAA